MNRLIVLDIDETLLHSSIVNQPFDFKFDIDGLTYYTKKRPHLKEFLEYCFENFNVAIWTAADKDYAEVILQNINISKSDLLFFYTKQNCSIKYNSETRNYDIIKPLDKVKYKISLNNILIVDDIIETARNNYGNIINIKKFMGDDNDNELLKLISYLEKIKNEPNFRSIEKRGWNQSS